MSTEATPTRARSRTRTATVTVIAAAAAVLVLAGASTRAGSTSGEPPDGITSAAADRIVQEARADARGTAAADALRDGRVTAAEHRRAVDDALACLERAAAEAGVEVRIRGPHRTPDGDGWSYTFGSAPTVGVDLPALERSCVAEHLAPVERARRARLAADGAHVAELRDGLDTCLAHVAPGVAVDDLPAPEALRRAIDAGAPVDELAGCAAAAELLLTDHEGGRGR